MAKLVPARVTGRVPCLVDDCDTVFDIAIDLVPQPVLPARPLEVPLRAVAVDLDGFRRTVTAHALREHASVIL